MNFTTLRKAAMQDTDTLVKFIMIVYMSLDDVNRDIMRKKYAQIFNEGGSEGNIST